MTTTTEMKFFSYSLQQIDGSCNLRITNISGVPWSGGSFSTMNTNTKCGKAVRLINFLKVILA